MDKSKKIFSEERCLSLKEILDYIHNRFSSKERNRIERHLMDCELCQEAVEGYSLAEEESKVISINERIKENIKNNGAVTFDWRRIAAIVTSIFIIGGGMYYLNGYLKNANEIAVSKRNNNTPIVQEKENVLKKIQTDSVIAIEQNTRSTRRDLKRKAESNSDGFISISEEEKEISNESKDNAGAIYIDTTFSTMPAPVSENVKVSKPAPEILDKSSLDESELSEVPAPSVMKADKEVKRRSIASAKNKKSEIYSAKSMAPSTSTGMAMDVKADSAQTINSSSENYKEGFNHYQNGEYKKAIDYFDKVDKGTIKFEDARWYKALSYIKLKKTSEAKTLFEEIVKEDGPFKKDAEKELMQLK